MKSALAFLFTQCIVLGSVLAQDNSETNSSVAKQPHGKFYFFWGYNRDAYTRSTIHFVNTQTDDYDFTFDNAEARDQPDYENFYDIEKLTIPQYNLHLGYFFNDRKNLGVEISWDHLKYIVKDYQNIYVHGQIREHQIDKDTLVVPSFVHLQHTNGNNYLMVNLLKKFSLSSHKNFEIGLVGKVGAGPLVSYTISEILGNKDLGYFHYHGFVTGLGVDLRIDLSRYFFIQTGVQGAFVNYTNTRLGADHVGKATHTFYSYQFIYGIGFTIPWNKKDKNE